MRFQFMFDFSECIEFLGLPNYDQFRLIQSAAVNECRARKLIDSDADLIVGTEVKACMPDPREPYMIPIVVELPMSVRQGNKTHAANEGAQQSTGNDGRDVFVSHYIPGAGRSNGKECEGIDTEHGTPHF